MTARSLRPLLWILGFGCLWIPVLDHPPLQTGAYVQDVRTDRATVAIVTAHPVVLRCEATGADGVAVVAQGHSAVGGTADADDGGAPRRRNAFALSGLAPGSRYTFAVRGEDGGLVDEGSFRTPPADDRMPIRFACVGDSGGQPWWVNLQRNPLFHWPARWQWLPARGSVRAVADSIAAYEPEFLLHLGDVVYPWGTHDHYGPAFFQPFAEVLRRAPCYVVLGNHDVMDAGGVQALANFVLPESDLIGDERCYAFAWGAVRVIVLDWNVRSLDAPIREGHPSIEFLRAELERATEPWLVVASHYPIRSDSRQRDRADLLLTGLPLLKEFAVDLYLCGHDHTYQRFGGSTPDDVPLVVSGGGGKSLYPIDDPRLDADVALSAWNWCSVEVSGRDLVLRAHSPDAEADAPPLDTLRLDRAEPARLARIRERVPARAARIAELLRE